MGPEFLPSLEFFQFPVLLQLITAALLGGAIGWEREWSGKEAGLRTNMLICVGSTLLTILSLRIGTYVLVEGPITADPSRLMAAVISGIGFLGAGTIIQARGNVTGLTTAATLWVVAAIGIAVGTRSFVVAVGSTVFVLVALVPLGQLEDRFFATATRTIQLRVDDTLSALVELSGELHNRELRIRDIEVRADADGEYDLRLTVEGNDEAIESIPLLLADRPGIQTCSVTGEPG